MNAEVQILLHGFLSIHFSIILPFIIASCNFKIAVMGAMDMKGINDFKNKQIKINYYQLEVLNQRCSSVGFLIPGLFPSSFNFIYITSNIIPSPFTHELTILGNQKTERVLGDLYT